MGIWDDVKDNGLLSRKVEDAKRARDDRVQQKSVGEVRVLDRIKQQEQEIDRIMNDASVRYESKLEQVTQLGSKIDELRKVAGRLDSARGYSGEKTFRQSIKSALSPRSQTEAITGVARSSQNLGTAMSMAESTSTFQLEQDRSRAGSLMARNNSRILAAEADQDQPGGAAKLDMAVRVQDKLVMQAGMADAALSVQKKMGTDTRSTLFGAHDTMRGVRADQGKEQIIEDVSAGRAGSRSQVQGQLEAAAKGLHATFIKLNEAVAGNTKDQKKHGEEFRKLDSQYKKHQQTLKEMDRQGGGKSRFNAAGGVVSDLGVMAQGAAQMYKTNYITSEMQQTQNRQGYAELSNQRFEDVYGAGKGDVAALRRVMSDQYSDQAARGSEYRDRGQWAKGLETSATAMKGAGTFMDQFDPGEQGLKNLWEGAKGFFTKGAGAGAVAQSAAQIGAKMTPDVVQFNDNLTDYRKDIQAGQTDINAQRQYRSYNDEKNKVADFVGQKGLDYYKAIGVATRGLGVGSGKNVGPSRDVDYYEGTGREAIGQELDTKVDKSTYGPVDAIKAEATRRVKGKPGFTAGEARAMRGAVNQEALSGFKDQIAGQQERNATRGWTGALGDAFGFGPSKEELRTRGKELRGFDRSSQLDPDMASARSLKNMKGLTPKTSLMATRLLNIGEDLGYGDMTITEGMRSSSRQAELKRQGVSKAGPGQSKHEFGMAVDFAFTDQKGEDGVFDKKKYKAVYDKYTETYGSEGIRWGGNFGDKSKTGKGWDSPHFEVTGGDMSKRPRPWKTEIVDGKEVNVFDSKTGGGGDRELGLAALMDQGVQDRLSEGAGIGQKQIPGLVSGFKAAIGRDFVENGVEKEMDRAGRAARVGYVDSAEQYVQARGMLSGVGGDGDDLEKIMKNAVAAGMDSSKNIMEMVGAVQQLGQASAGYGIDTAASTAGMLGAAVQGLRTSGVSKNMAVKAAQQGLNTVENFGTSGEYDIFNNMEFSGLRSDFKGAEMYELEALQTASPGQLKELQRLQELDEAGKGEFNPETGRRKSEELGTQMGIGGVLTNSDKTKKALKRTQEQVIRRTMGLGFNTKLEESIMGKIGTKKFDELTKEEQRFFNARAKQTGKASGAAVWSGATTKAKEGDFKYNAEGKYTDAVEKAIGSEGVLDAKLFNDGAKMLAEAGKSLIGIALSSHAAAKGANAKDIFDETQAAAKDMKSPINTFKSGAIKPLDESVKKFTGQMNGLIEKMEGIMKKTGMDPLSQGKKK